MTVAERIFDRVKDLPEEKQREVMDFVEYLRARTLREQNADWSYISLTSAMRGMEQEESPYTLEDIKEMFS